MVLLSRLKWMLYRLRRRKARQRAVQEFRRSLALFVDREALEASIATRLKELFDPDRLLIFQHHRASSSLRPTFFSGVDNSGADGLQIGLHGRLARWFLVNETCLLVTQDRGVFHYLQEDEQRILSQLDIQLCAPMLSQNQLVGILMLGSSRAERQPSRRDGELLQQLASQASLAFQNVALYREQRERLDRLHRADRLAAVGQLAAGVAHEVRNPLTAIRSTMQYLQGVFASEDPKRELIAELIDEVDRIDSTISGLLSLTRSGEFQPSTVDLIPLLQQTVHLVVVKARKQGVELQERYEGSSLPLEADGGQLRQVFLNLILNAMQAMPEGGHIAVAAFAEEPATMASASWLRVEIADDGPGIAPDKLKRVFDPFFTTKSEGTGLGLAICHGIIQRHGGEIELLSTEGKGTAAVVKLPQRREQTARAATALPAQGSVDGQDIDR